MEEELFGPPDIPPPLRLLETGRTQSQADQSSGNELGREPTHSPGTRAGQDGDKCELYTLLDNVHTRSITTSLMAEDTHTKAVSDQVKRVHLCQLGGLFDSGPSEGIYKDAQQAEWIHQRGLKTIVHGIHRPVGTDMNLMLPGMENQLPNFGWHSVDSSMIIVAREPRMHRVPEDITLSFRTTRLRTTK